MKTEHIDKNVLKEICTQKIIEMSNMKMKEYETQIKKDKRKALEEKTDEPSTKLLKVSEDDKEPLNKVSDDVSTKSVVTLAQPQPLLTHTHTSNNNSSVKESDQSKKQSNHNIEPVVTNNKSIAKPVTKPVSSTTIKADNKSVQSVQSKPVSKPVSQTENKQIKTESYVNECVLQSDMISAITEDISSNNVPNVW